MRADRALRRVSSGEMRACIDRPGIEHIDCFDGPFWNAFMTPETRPGTLKTIADTRAMVRAFFEGTVRGDWADFKRLASEGGKQPDLSVHLFGMIWP